MPALSIQVDCTEKQATVKVSFSLVCHFGVDCFAVFHGRNFALLLMSVHLQLFWQLTHKVACDKWLLPENWDKKPGKLFQIVPTAPDSPSLSHLCMCKVGSSCCLVVFWLLVFGVFWFFGFTGDRIESSAS